MLRQTMTVRIDEIDPSSLTTFSNLPLSQKTLKGLKENNFKNLTEIQRESIGLGLQGLDVLGAAKTGSGKTLAFLIPVLENLYCKQWTRLDGLGALIITPTRELAYQIFETLRKVGIHHDLSAGLIIGGKDLHFEKKRMDQCNIVICTPGRLLQHMDQNPLFNCTTMQILVLDEADRCLDMGFEQTMNAIIDNLPPTRQTLLFSATQTKSVRDLARLSLNDPMYVSVHENSKYSTPETLQQSYVVCELHEKVNLLWSFIKAHIKQKILIFMSSCKQVKYHYDLFCRMRPGTSLLQLQGTLHQLKRMSIYESFCKKSNVVMFATDIAARGLDFPEVNWVIQMDCPEDANTYIHRAGRTARYQNGGESLLVLLPSEEHGMLEELKAKKIPINKIQVNPSKMSSPFRKIEAFLAQNSKLKESAQRAFVAYIKSVFLMKNKKVFNVHALDTSAYSASLGLAVPPRIRFLKRLNKRIEEQAASIKNKKQSNIHTIDANESALKTISSEELSSDEEETEGNSIQNVKSKSRSTLNFDVNIDSDDDGDVLKVKRRNHELKIESFPEVAIEEKYHEKKPLTKAALAKKILHKKIIPNKKTVYDEEGRAMVDPTKEKVTDVAKEYEAENEGGIDIEKAKLILREEDKVDKQRFREKLKAKRREEKRKLKKARKAEVEEPDEEVEKAEDISEEGNESDYSSGPDLSWLPDPDEIYKKKSSEDESDADLSSGPEEQFHKAQPLKRKNSNSNKGKKKKFKLQEDQPLDTGLSLMEDEELALQFLKNST